MPVTINGTTGITTPNLNSAGTVTTSSLVNGTALAFRNKIINGNFGINQRAYVSGTATSGANQYTLDRWRVVTSGQNLTFSASGTGNIVTAPAGGIEQVIESLNIEGGTYTLSWTGTATGAVNGSAVSNGGQVTLTANTNATIKFSSGTVSLVQLEAGSVATPFENRPIGTELALCQRYYWRNEQTSTSFAYGAGIVTNTTTVECYVKFPQRMRVAPTATYSGLRLRLTGLSPTVSTLASNFAGTDSSDIVFTATGGGLPTGYSVIIQNNGINDFLAFESEL